MVQRITKEFHIKVICTCLWHIRHYTQTTCCEGLDNRMTVVVQQSLTLPGDCWEFPKVGLH